MKSLLGFAALAGIGFALMALPSTPIPMALPAKPTVVTQYISYTNYVYPKATNYVNVTNWLTAPIGTLIISNLWLPSNFFKLMPPQ